MDKHIARLTKLAAFKRADLLIKRAYLIKLSKAARLFIVIKKLEKSAGIGSLLSSGLKASKNVYNAAKSGYNAAKAGYEAACKFKTPKWVPRWFAYSGSGSVNAMNKARAAAAEAQRAYAATHGGNYNSWVTRLAKGQRGSNPYASTLSIDSSFGSNLEAVAARERELGSYVVNRPMRFQSPSYSGVMGSTPGSISTSSYTSSITNDYMGPTSGFVKNPGATRTFTFDPKTNKYSWGGGEVRTNNQGITYEEPGTFVDPFTTNANGQKVLNVGTKENPRYSYSSFVEKKPVTENTVDPKHPGTQLPANYARRLAKSPDFGKQKIGVGDDFDANVLSASQKANPGVDIRNLPSNTPEVAQDATNATNAANAAKAAPKPPKWQTALAIGSGLGVASIPLAMSLFKGSGEETEEYPDPAQMPSVQPDISNYSSWTPQQLQQFNQSFKP